MENSNNLHGPKRRERTCRKSQAIGKSTKYPQKNRGTKAKKDLN